MSTIESMPFNIGRNEEFNPDKCQESVLWGDVGMHYHQCRRNPQKGSDYCWQHQRDRMEERRKAMIESRLHQTTRRKECEL